jgi:hypothetical protein
MPTAVTGQQVTLPVSVDAYSCLSFGHSAWLTPCGSIENAPCCARMAKTRAGTEPALLKPRGVLRPAFINPCQMRFSLAA